MILTVSTVQRRAALLAAAAVLVFVVIAAAYAAFHSIGRTPESGFIREAFGSESVVFDRVYDGSGPSENRTRTVVLRTSRAPQEVLAAIAANGGWRALGGALARQSDGLCVVAFPPKDYLSTPRRQRSEDVRTVTELEPSTVVLSLLYC